MNAKAAESIVAEDDSVCVPWLVLCNGAVWLVFLVKSLRDQVLGIGTDISVH